MNVREKRLNFFHLWKVVFKHCSINETLIVQASILVAESRFVWFNFTFGGEISLFSSIDKKNIYIYILGSCVYIVKGYIYPVCVNIPIVELLLSWLGLFYLSSIINDLLPVSNFLCFFGTRGIFKCNSWERAKPSRNVVETNRGGC